MTEAVARVERILQQRLKKDPSITMDDVKSFFSKNVEQKAKARGQNSFVAKVRMKNIRWTCLFSDLKDTQNSKLRLYE